MTLGLAASHGFVETVEEIRVHEKRSICFLHVALRVPFLSLRTATWPSSDFVRLQTRALSTADTLPFTFSDQQSGHTHLLWSEVTPTTRKVVDA